MQPCGQRQQAARAGDGAPQGAARLPQQAVREGDGSPQGSARLPQQAAREDKQ